MFDDGRRVARKLMAKSTSKRELVEPHAGDKRYIRRDEQGRIKESVDVSKSLSSDQKTKARNKAKPGHGDRGDRQS